MGLIHKHTNTPPPTPDTLGVDVPEDLWDVVARMLAKDPGDRFESYGDLVDALESSIAA